MEDYLGDADNMDNPILPASMGISDPLLSTLIQELAGLQTEYYSSGVGERNPLQGQLELRIRNSKKAILLRKSLSHHVKLLKIEMVNSFIWKFIVATIVSIGVTPQLAFSRLLYTELIQFVFVLCIK